MGDGRWEGEEREGFIAAECRECRPRHWQNALEGNHEQNLTSGGALGAPITESQRKAPILNGLIVSTGRAAAPVVTGLCGISSGSGSREPSERVAEERVARLDGCRSSAMMTQQLQEHATPRHASPLHDESRM